MIQIKLKVFLLTFVIFVLSAVTALAAPEPGALRGKAFSNYRVTDGKDDTFWNAGSFNSTYTFSTETEVTGVYFNGSGDDLVLQFYDSSKKLLGTVKPVYGASNSYRNFNFKAVKSVRLYAPSSAFSKVVNEVDLRVIEVDLTPPAIPVNLAVKPGVNNLLANWDAVSDSDLAGYNIYVNGIKKNNKLVNTTSFKIPNLTPLINYAVQVSSIDFSGNESIKSSVVYAMPMNEEQKPHLQFNNVKDTSINLSWDKVSNEFEIYQDDVLIKKQSFTSIAMTGLTANTSYDFKVISIDQFKRRVTSNIVTVTTKDLILDKPKISIKDIKHDTALVEWDAINTATSYDLLVNDDLLKQMVDTSYTLTNLSPNKIYSIKVVAKSDTQRAESNTSFTTKHKPVPTVTSAKTTIDKADNTKRDLSYQASSDVTEVDVFVNGNLVGTYPVGQDIKLDFSSLATKMAEIEVKPTDPEGVGYKTSIPVETTGHELIDEVTGEMINQYDIIRLAFMIIAVLSIPLIIIVVLFFWLRKRFKPMIISADDKKPFDTANSTNSKSNFAKGKKFAVDRTKNEKFVYQPRQPRYKKEGFEIEKYEKKLVPVGFMGVGGYKEKVDITYRKNDVLYKQRYVKGQGRVFKPIDSKNQIKHVRNQFQSVKNFATGNYKKK